MNFKCSKALAILSTLFSINVNAMDLQDLSGFPKWFLDALSQEVNISKTSELKIEPLNINGNIKGEIAAHEGSENYWYYSINIGADTPVECHVFSEFDGATTVFNRMIDHGLNASVEFNKKPLVNKFNFAIDAGAIGNTPYMQFDTLYTLGDEKQTISGLLKGFVANTKESLQICMHNSVGYRQAFYDVFESFIQTFNQSKQNDAFFDAIYTMSFNDIPVGYGTERYLVDADGDIELKVDNSYMFPVDQSSFSHTDSGFLGWARADGTLINALSATIENGELSSSVSVELSEEKWVVNGKLQGKEINTTLEHTGPIMSNIGSYFVSAELAKSEETSKGLVMWIPEADPTSVQNVTVYKTEDESGYNRKMDMGPMSLTYLADENNVVQHGKIAQGPIVLEMKLAYTSGAPKLP